MRTRPQTHTLREGPLPRPSSAGIQRKFILLLLAILIPVLFIQALLYFDRYRNRRELVEETNLEVARSVSRSFQYLTEDLFRQELAVGSAITMMESPPVEKIEELLDLNRKEFPSLKELAWVSPNGRVIASTNRASKGEDTSERAFYQKIKAGEDKDLGDLFLLMPAREAVFTISRGIRDGEGVLQGILAAVVDPRQVRRVFSIERRAGGTLGVIDSRGRAVLRYPEIEMSWEERGMLTQYPQLTRVLAGEEVTATIYSHLERRKRMFAAVPLGSTGWAAMAWIGEKEAMESFVSGLLIHGMLFLLVTLSGFALALRMSRRIITTTEELQRYAHALGEGRIKERLTVSGPAEFIDVADSFHYMTQRMHSREKALLDLQDSLEGIVKERTEELRRANEVLRAEVAGREEAAAALRAERKRLFALLDSLPAFVYLRAPDYSIRFANSSFKKSFGEVEGRPCFEVLSGRKEPCQDCPSNKVLRTGRPCESEWVHPGSGKTYQVYSYPFQDSDHSLLVMELGIDITRRKQAEEALRESEEFNRTLVENMADRVYAKDLEGRYILFNKATSEYWGVPVEMAIGKTDWDIHAQETAETFVASDRTVLESQAPFATEERVRTRDGREAILSVVKAPLRDAQGKVIGLVGISRDITQKKQTEDALRQSEGRLRDLSAKLLSAQEDERKSLAREIHDSLGSSLTAIKLSLELTLSQMQGEQALKEHLETAVSWTQHAIEEARRITTDLRPSTLDDMGLLPTLDWFFRQYRCAYPGIHIESTTLLEESDIPQTLKTVIFRIVQEAFHNIGKYSGAEYVDLSLLRTDHSIELTIEDNGDGFDLEAVLSGKNRGGGLGLTSMRERTELSGGSFEIISVIGMGTVIRATWPL